MSFGNDHIKQRGLTKKILVHNVSSVETYRWIAFKEIGENHFLLEFQRVEDKKKKKIMVGKPGP